MDRRNLLFIISVSITLFFVNMYFTYQDAEKYQAWKKATEEVRAKQSAELEKYVADRIADWSQLPLKQVTSDQEGLFPNGWAVTLKGQTFVLPGSEGKEFYLNGKKLSLRSVDRLKMEGDSIEVGDIDPIGHFPLQLVSIDESTTEPGKVTYAEIIDGSFVIPVNPPQNDAIALMKTSKGYLPVGYYTVMGGEFTYFTSWDGINVTVYRDPTAPVKSSPLEQKYFVLENSYQQLVFTNVGGALAEINLSFKTEQNPGSVVREIGLDQSIVKQAPALAKFPQKNYLTPTGEKEPVTSGYYPLYRRENPAADPIPPALYGLNIVSEYPEVAQLVYEVKSFTDREIVFEAVQKQRRITKTFRLPEDADKAPYVFDLTINVAGDSRGLWLTSGVPEVEWISNAPAPDMKYRQTRGEKNEVIKVDLPNESITISSVSPDWAVNSNGFFGVILDPLSKVDAGLRAAYVPGELVLSRLVEVDRSFERYMPKDLPGYSLMIPLNSSGGKMDFRVYAGPLSEWSLMTVDKTFTDPSTGYSPDYIGTQTFHGWFTFISEPFAKFLFFLMKQFHWITGSWAISIILLTVVLRILLYPLNSWSMTSMKKMQEIGPEIQKIQEKHKKDPSKAQMEIMEIYRKAGVNPFSGCLPLLIQMPFLIGMFDLLKTTFELRGAPFIPGWIDNLTAPDVLFMWDYPFPFFGNEFHLLPVLLGGVMYLQSRISSNLPKNPAEWNDQQRQQKAMGTMMTVMFTVMFYNFPSGLNIYWLSSMLLGVAQQWWINKQKSVTK
jgi:YidC/Oxa1 family membrane protein insertase